MSIAAACVAVLAFAVVHVATNQPWLGLGLERDPATGAIRIAHVAANGPAAAIRLGQRLASVAGLALEPDDLVDEPDTLDRYAVYQRVLARQGELRERLLQPQVALGLGRGGAAVETVSPALRRPVASLPPSFWSQMFAGASGFLIGAWVWSLRRRELSGRLMAIGSAGLLVMIFPAAIYSTRELALDPDLFRWLAAIDHLGALGFGVAMVALFYVYPHSLVPPKALLALPALFGAWWAADTAWIVFDGPPLGFHLAALVLMLMFLPAAVLQYLRTRDDPVKRAALRWFALAVGLGTGAFITLIVLPNLFRHEQVIAQAHAFLLFIIVYGGVAIGVARYRLFELEGWAFGVLFYVAGALVLVLLDAFLIFAMSLERVPALGVALMAVALFYLPLRDMLHRRIVGRAVDHGALFQQTVDVALTPPGADQNARWAALLARAFNPLRIDAGGAAGAPAAPAIRDDGLSLVLPGFGDVRPVTLGYAHAGRKLFSREDRKLARELCMMLDHAIRSRQAREDGVAEERARISRDMHDNIGARLLSALHSADGGRKDAMIREALRDLRGVINDDSGASQSLEETLADLRVETDERCEAATIDLSWETSASPDAVLPPVAVHAVRSIIREAVSNVIRHAEASALAVAVDCRPEWIDFVIRDNGRGMGPAAGGGAGLDNIRERLAALGGRFDIADAEPGTRLSATVPLPKGSVA